MASERRRILSGDNSEVPGMVRISCGCYNNTDDIDRLIEMLERIIQGQVRGDYWPKPSTGEYVPAGYREPLSDFFLLQSH